MLEEELHEEHQEIGFCHNDLQYGNIMIDDETNAITIIVSFSFTFTSALSP
jgi:choline/ethanolamine kinase